MMGEHSSRQSSVPLDRGCITPLDHPTVLGMDSVNGLLGFMLTPRVLGREG